MEAIHFDAPQQLGGLGVDYLDRTVHTTRPCNNGRVINMSDRVISSIIRRPPLSAFSTSQRDGFSYLVRSAADGDNRVISQVGPDFVGLGDIERLTRIPPQP